MNVLRMVAAAPPIVRDAHSEVQENLDRAAELLSKGAAFEAETLLNRAWALAEADLEWSDPLIGAVVLALGDLHWRLGRYKDAEGAFQYALFVIDGDLELEAAGHHGLGHVLSLLGVRAAGIRHARKALELRERCCDDPFDIACERVALATVLASAGEKDEAETLLVQATEALGQIRGGRSHALALALHRLGIVVGSSGRAAEALVPLRSAVRRVSRTVGASHPVAMMITHDLAAAYVNADSPSQAKELWEVARGAAAATPIVPTAPTVRAELCPVCVYRHGRIGER